MEDKQRILGDMGHVSNEDAGHAMTDVITGNTKRIYYRIYHKIII